MDKKLILELESYIEDKLYKSAYNMVDSYIKEESLNSSIENSELKKFSNGKREALFSETLLQMIEDKNTAIALALMLKLDVKDANRLLKAKGYILSDSNMSDLVIRFFIEKEIYDINLINEALHHLKLKPLIL